jgi:hypothetical protein
MNVQIPRSPSIDLVKRLDIELGKCAVLRARYEASGEADRATNAELLGRTAFWACIAFEDLAARGMAPAGRFELAEIVSLRNAIADAPTDAALILRAHERLKGDSSTA